MAALAARMVPPSAKVDNTRSGRIACTCTRFCNLFVPKEETLLIPVVLDRRERLLTASITCANNSYHVTSFHLRRPVKVHLVAGMESAPVRCPTCDDVIGNGPSPYSAGDRASVPTSRRRRTPALRTHGAELSYSDPNCPISCESPGRSTTCTASRPATLTIRTYEETRRPLYDPVLLRRSAPLR